MIPAKAVEAAMIAFAQAPHLVNNQAQMTLALEAAAPYMLAGAWGEARADLYEIISHSFYNEFQDPSGHTADAIIAAGYRKDEAQ